MLELVASLVILIFAGQGISPFVYATQFLLVTVYFYADVFYILYIVHLRFRLPAEMRTMIPLAFVGFGTQMKSKFSGRGGEEKEIDWFGNIGNTKKEGKEAKPAKAKASAQK